jgi:prepilin-type N-terminal cleavage/methylation domain-containing protein/prepilin-type processing-associated H-X9-DG protein
MCKRAFTLIELLVVVAVIAILAAILFPMFGQSRERARAASCQSNMMQISKALLMYAQDHDDYMPSRLPNVPPVNGGTMAYIPYSIQVMPYIKSDHVWKCPSDDVPRKNAEVWDGKYDSVKGRKMPLSYGYVGPIDTAEGHAKRPPEAPDWNTGMYKGVDEAGRALSAIPEPSDTVALVESWATFSYGQNDLLVGGPRGSLVVNCDTWKLPGRKLRSKDPIDNFPGPCESYYDASNGTPARGHFDRGNVVFADGHAKSMSWAQLRGNDFRVFKLHKPAKNFSP